MPQFRSFRGKAVGMIVGGGIPAAQFIVIGEHRGFVVAVMLMREDDEGKGSLSETHEYSFNDDFVKRYSLKELKSWNPGGWEAFKKAFPRLAKKMEAAG